MLRRENEVLAKVISALKQLASVDTAQKTQIIIGDSGSGARYLPVSQQQLGAQSKRIENQVRIEQLQTVTELNERLSDFLELFSSKLQTAAGPELRDLLNRADPEIRAHDPVLFQIIESTIFGDTPSYGVLTTISEPTQVTPRLRVELLKAVSAGLILFFLLVIVSKALAILRVRAH